MIPPYQEVASRGAVVRQGLPESLILSSVPTVLGIGAA
jgi:hypothetical protein